MAQTDTFVILTPGFPSDEYDSTCLPAQQRFVLTLKKNFPALNLIILSFQYPYQSEKYYWNGIEVIPFNGRNRARVHRLLLWRKVWKELESIRSSGSISGIMSFWYGECAFVGKRFADKYSLRHICWLLGQDAKNDNRYVQRAHLAPDEMAAVSDFVADEFERNFFIRPAYVIPNGITSVSEKVPLKDIDVIGVGSLIPLKRYNRFIDCIDGIRRYFPQIRAVICGKGPEEATLLRHIEKCGLSEKIFLPGELDTTDVQEMMQRSKVLLHPSSYEGFSTVCLEALAAGTQVISFCQPMHENIPGWHVVSSFPEMQMKLIELLNENENCAPSAPYLMTDSVIRLMDLFSYEHSAKSSDLI
ncbi:MAG: glycosyltransferase [Flavisolibacter sp.]